MVKYCANCGRKLPDEALYCPNCGKEYIPRYKADHYSDSSDDLNSSADSSKNGFDSPFDDFSNKNSTGPSTSSSKNKSSSSSIFDNLSFGRACLILFIILFLFFATTFILEMNNDLNDYDTSSLEDSIINISNASNGSNIDYHDDGVNIESNEPYNMSIDKTAYLSSKGKVQLIDFNHSYNLVNEDFNITEYESYYVALEDANWYVITIYKCKFDSPAQRQVFATDYVEKNPFIVYNGKGNDVAYAITILDSSNNSTYKNIGFLESIFHYEKE